MTTPQTAQALARNLWLLRNLADGLRLYGAPDKDQMARHMEGVADDIAALTSQATAPIDMVLHCPKCGKQHIDAPEWKDDPHDIEHGMMRTWTNPPHRSHLCRGCGHIWRPADVPTNGVAAVKTKGKDDSPIGSAEAPAAPAQAPHWFSYGLHCARQVDAANQRCAELQSKLDAVLAATPPQAAAPAQADAADDLIQRLHAEANKADDVHADLMREAAEALAAKPAPVVQPLTIASQWCIPVELPDRRIVFMHHREVGVNDMVMLFDPATYKPNGTQSQQESGNG